MPAAASVATLETTIHPFSGTHTWRGNPRSERSVTIISCHIVKFELAGKSGTCGADSGPDITRYIDCTSAGLAASAVVTWWKLPTMACITLFRRKEDGYKVIKQSWLRWCHNNCYCHISGELNGLRTTYVGVAVEDRVLQRAEDVSVDHLGLHIHGEAGAGEEVRRPSV